MQLWILIIIYNLRVEPSLPTSRFFWAEMFPSETNWNFSMPSWHQSLVLEPGPGAFIVPIWSNSISTFDVWSDAWLELQARIVGGIRGTKFCTSGINACEKWLRHITQKHGLKIALINIGNLLATSWVSPMNDGLAECCNGNRLEEDPLDVQQCIRQTNSNSFPESSIGMIGKTWLQTRSNGW